MAGADRLRALLGAEADERKAEVRRRRAEASWLAWTMDEFLRYFYGVGVLAVLLFVPLQMADAWLPFGRPPAMSPALVALLALAFDVAALYMGLGGYTALWRHGGVVDRWIARHDREG